ncbi:hypothetical protein LA76x_1765 [Lysobacter antibioticus]|uniref:Secreted protein n=1 Tax=Lysobacter antibioticus TaxID=84531 RepID=A0A0S2F8P1_LYSAN|nr:hypothetical protein LA76x_1765 [Lysobacter antibioticus]
MIPLRKASLVHNAKAGLSLASLAAICASSAWAATSDYDHLYARVSHSCDAPYSLQVTLSNPGKADIQVMPGGLPWSTNANHIRIRGYEVQRGQRAKRLSVVRIIDDHLTKDGEIIPAGGSQSGDVELNDAFEHAGLDDLSEIPVLIKIDFPMPSTYPGPPQFEHRIHNVVVHGPSIELYVPARRRFGTPCPVFTVLPGSSAK